VKPCGIRAAQRRAHPLEILRRIDPGRRRLIERHHVNPHAVLECAQLLELFGVLERRRRPARKQLEALAR